MSWIFGFKGRCTHDCQTLFSKVHPSALHVVQYSDLYIATGGNPNTCHYLPRANSSSGCLVSGIIRDNHSYQILSAKAMQVLPNIPEYLKNCDGHFVALQWDDTCVQVFTDDLGLRELYIARYQDGYLFSTRADWVAKFIDTEIDFSAFGSGWVLVNQMSKNCFLKNISRVTMGDVAVISNDTLKITEHQWLPGQGDPVRYKDFDRLLEHNIQACAHAGKKLTLSLSGGMDSRVVLAYLRNIDISLWDAHTFGAEDTNDVQVASAICRDLQYSHRILNNNHQTPSLEELTEYVCQSKLTHSASFFTQFKNYDVFKGTDELIIDGGFGEIWRLEFLTRLRSFHKKALLQKNPYAITGAGTSYRTNCFSDEIVDQMFNGAVEQITFLFDKLPSIDQIGLHNWIDLFALKTRFPNFYGPEQSRLDSFTNCLMPFGQKSILENLFRMPVSDRKNGKVFYKILKKRSPELLRYELAKGNTKHPVRLTSFQTRLWLLAAKIKNRHAVNTSKMQFLQQYKEFINDTLTSNGIMQSGRFVPLHIDHILQNFNRQSYDKLDALDWLLAFILYEKSIHKKIDVK